MQTYSRRTLLTRFLPALAPITLAQGYPYGEELPPPPMTEAEYAKEIKDIKLAMSMLRADRNMDRADLDAIQECVTGCHLIMPEEIEL